MRRAISPIGVSLLVVAIGCADRIAPPIADPGAAPAEPRVGAPVQLDGTASSDPQGRAIEFRWSISEAPAGSEASFHDPSMAKPWFTPDRAGDYIVRLVVNNGILESEPADLTVTVGPCGAAPPVIEEVRFDPKMPITGQTVQLQATVRDADIDECALDPAQTLSFAWRFTRMPAGSAAVLNQPTAQNPSFEGDVPGEYEVELVVTDSAGVSSEPAPVAITVGTCGDNAPTIEEITAEPPKPATGETVQLGATVTDVDNGMDCDLGQSLGFSWNIVALPTGSHAALNDPAAENPSFTPDTPGVYVIELRVTDSTGRESTPAELKVEADPCGSRPPDVGKVAIAPAAPNTGDTVLLSISPTDPDNGRCKLGQTLSVEWSFVELPAGSAAAFNDAGAFTPAFTADVPGDYVARVVATDSTGREDSVEVSVTVSTCGSRAPSVDDVTHAPDPTNTYDRVDLSVMASDADVSEVDCALTQDLSYAWWFAAMPAGSSATLGAVATAGPWFTPDVPGTYTVVVVVADSTGRASAPFAHDVVVSSCGTNPPTVTAPGVAAMPAAPAVGSTVTLSAAVDDADNAPECGSLGQTLSREWSLVAPVGSSARLNSTTAAAPGLVADVAGDYLVTLTVTDSTGRSGSASLTVTAGPCGTNAPTVTAPGVAAMPAAPAVGSTVTLSAAVDDADNAPECGSLGQTLSREWSLVPPAGSGARLNSTTAAAPGFVADVAGEYLVTLTVTDSTGRSGSASLTVTAGPCGTNAPTVTAPGVVAMPAAPAVGSTVTLSAAVDDADNAPECGSLGQTLSREWSLVPPAGSGARLNSATAAAPGFVADVAGDYLVTLTVTDSTGRSGSASLTVTAGPCGTNAPTVTAPGVAAMPAAPAVGSTVTLSAAVDDADNAPECGSLGQTLSREWSLVPPAGSGARLNSATAAAPGFVADVAGDYLVTLTVTDSTGRSGSASLTMTAGPCGTNAPTVTAPGVVAMPGTGVVGEPVVLSAAVDDADNGVACGSLGQTLSRQWSLVPPAGSSSALNNASIAGPAFIPDMAGDYLVTLTVTDSTGRSGSASLTVTAGPCGAQPPDALVAELSPFPGSPGASVIGPTVAPGTIVQLDCSSSSDPDDLCTAGGDPVTCAWSFDELPPGSGTFFNAATMTPSFETDVAGTYVVRLTVTDSTGLSDAAFFTITADPAVGVVLGGGFAISTLRSGTAQGLDLPQGIAVNAAGNIFVVNRAPENIVQIPPSGVSHTTFAAGGCIAGAPEDIVFHATEGAFFVTDSGGDEVCRVTALGAQSVFSSVGNAPEGIASFTTCAAEERLVVSWRGDDLIRVHNASTGAVIAPSTDFDNLAQTPRGAAGACVSATNRLFATRTGGAHGVIRTTWGVAMTSAVVSSDASLNDPRDVVLTPCPTPKLVIAAQGGNTVTVVDNCGAPPCAATLLVSGLIDPWGLAFESATSLLLTDRGSNSLYRITGPFCSL